MEALIEDLQKDMRERYVRQEEFSDYKQSVKEQIELSGKKHEELRTQVVDHE